MSKTWARSDHIFGFMVASRSASVVCLASQGVPPSRRPPSVRPSVRPFVRLLSVRSFVRLSSVLAWWGRRALGLNDGEFKLISSPCRFLTRMGDLEVGGVHAWKHITYFVCIYIYNMYIYIYMYIQVQLQVKLRVQAQVQALTQEQAQNSFPN